MEIVRKRTGKRKEERNNPFEIRFNKKKHVVFGQRRTSITGISRSTAIRKRKRTLLQEYKQCCKSNLFVDRRLSEIDGVTPYKRNTLKKMLTAKKCRTEDVMDDGDQVSLTHCGKSLWSMDDFDSTAVSEGDGEEDSKSPIFMRKSPRSEIKHKEKTRKQTFEMVISKSKALKYERQSEKEEVQELFERVDLDLKDVLGVLPKCRKEPLLSATSNYEEHVRELMFEGRSLATATIQQLGELSVERKNTRHLEAARNPMSWEKTSMEETINCVSDAETSSCCCHSVEKSAETNQWISDEKHLDTSAGSNMDILFERFAELDQCTSLEALKSCDDISRLLFKCCQANPVDGENSFLQLLSRGYTEWIVNREYPPLSKLLIFKVIGFIFSTSAIEHSVVTPAMLLMAQLLRKCEVKTRHHLIHGLFVCDALLDYLSETVVFMPELVNYLTSCCGSFIEDGVVFPPFDSPTLNVKCDGVNFDNLPSLPCLLFGCHEDVLSKHSMDYAILMHTLLLISKVLKLYFELPSFTEIFLPLTFNLQRLSYASPGTKMQKLLSMVIGILSAKPRPRRPLHLRQKPQSILFYTPKFDFVFERKGRGRPGLQKKVRKEEKGAIREIRKDNCFLAKEILKGSLRRNSERMKKTKEILRDLQAQ